MPALRDLVGEATLHVVGKDAVPAVRELCSSADWCCLEGFVPDLRDAYRGAAAFAAPLRFAAGVQNKILESMAAGVPVVTSSVGNRGLGAKDGREIVIADGADEFAQELAGLMSNTGRRHELAADGRRFVQETFSWSKALERVESLVDRSSAEHVASGRSGATA